MSTTAHRSQARRRRQATLLLLVPLVLAAALVLPACGSDSEGADAKGSVPKATTTTEAKGDASKVIEVHAMDYAFSNLPKSVEPGTRLTLVNDAETEPHELVAIKLPAEEKRSVEDLLKLSEDELGALMGGPPAMVLLAAPGKPQIPAVGDGTLTEKGRYLVMCSIPEGSDASILDSDEPPADNGKPPHFAHGMYGEVTVA